MSTQPVIRITTAEDAASISRLYAPYVEHTTSNFELTPPTIEEIRQRIKKVNSKWCWLLCEVDGRLAGYAYGGQHRSRSAYDWSCETSIYVDEDFKRRGIATALYTSLLEVLQLQGFFNAYAGITLPNDPSVRFHESLGYQYFGSYENVGFKGGDWHTVGWWRKVLQPVWSSPPPLKTIEELMPSTDWEIAIRKGLSLIH